MPNRVRIRNSGDREPSARVNILVLVHNWDNISAHRLGMSFLATDILFMRSIAIWNGGTPCSVSCKDCGINSHRNSLRRLVAANIKAWNMYDVEDEIRANLEFMMCIMLISVSVVTKSCSQFSGLTYSALS